MSPAKRKVKCLAKIVCKFQEQQIGEAQATHCTALCRFLPLLFLWGQVLAKLSQQVLDGKAEVRNSGTEALCVQSLSLAEPARFGTSMQHA